MGGSDKSRQDSRHNKTYVTTGCPKKKGDLRLNAPRGLQKWATDKSWVSFEKFRKFPVQWAQKLCIFTQNCLRYKGSKLATLTLKYYPKLHSWKYFFSMKWCLTHNLIIFPMQPRKNGLLRIKFHPSKHSEMPFWTIRWWTQAQVYDSWFLCWTRWILSSRQAGNLY